MIRYLFLILLGIGTHTSAQKIHLPIKVDQQWTFLEVTDETTELDEASLYDHLGDVNLPWFGQADTQSGYYQVEQNGKLGLVTVAFQPVISPAWRDIHPISDQYFLVADIEGYTVIDRKEKPLLPGDRYQAIRLTDPNDLSFFMLKQAGKWGVKKQGQQNWSVPPDFDELAFIDVGTEGFFKVKKAGTAEDKWQVIDWQGSNLPGLTAAFDRVEAAGRNYLAVQETSGKSNWSIRDLNGKELLLLAPEAIIKPLNDYLFSYKEKGSDTFAVLAMRNVITPLVEQFHFLQKINEELVFYRLGTKAGFIQSSGQLLEIDEDSDLDVFPGQGRLLRIRGRTAEGNKKQWGLFSLLENRIIQDCQYDSIAPFTGRVTRVMQDRKVGLINDAGELIAPTRFESISYPAEDNDSIYAYWKDSVQVYPVDAAGNLTGEPYAGERTANLGPDKYYWPTYELMEDGAAPVSNSAPSFPVSEKNEKDWQELISEEQPDTLWMEAGKSYWQLEAENYQLMQWEEVEVVVREKRASSSKKKKKRRKKSKKRTPPTPKKTELVMKWVAKGAPVKFLRKPSGVDWTLAYQDEGGLVSNELTYSGNTRFSVRKIGVFLNDSNTLLPGVEMIGIRLSDFTDGLPYAAFMDVNGKIGLINKTGKQATNAEGEPLRFTYISKVAEGKMQVCHATSAFSQVGLSLTRLLEEFNVELVRGSGDYTSALKSDKKALWGYIDPEGTIVIPFEYEVAAPFKANRAVNKKNEKWGMINADNEALIPFEYKAIFKEKGNWKVVKEGKPEGALYYDADGRRYEQKETARLAVQGHRLFPFELNGEEELYGYVDRKGTVVITPQFEYASKFYDGLATVRKGRKWFFIDEMGKEVVTMDSTIIGIIEVGNFNEGLCPIRKTTVLNKKPTRKYGYLNLEGQLAIPPVFDGAGMFQDDLAIVDSLNLADYRPGQEGGIPRDLALIDRAGNLITDYEFRRIGPFNEAGFAEVIQAKTGKQGMIGKDGRLLTNTYYTRVKSFEDGMAGFNGTSWKVFDYTGKEIPLPVPNVSSITYFADHDLVVKDKSDHWYHLAVREDKTEIMQGNLQFLQPFDHGYALARMEDQNRLYGEDQSWVQAEDGQLIKSWSGKRIGMTAGGSEFYANLGLQNVFARTFDAIDDFTDNSALVKYQGKSGIINGNGMFVVPPKFEAVSRAEEGYLQVQLPGRRYGLWSEAGKEIVPAQYDTIRYLDNGIICVEDGDLVGYYRGDGTVIWEPGE